MGENRVTPSVINETMEYLDTRFAQTMDQQTQDLDRTLASFNDGTLNSNTIATNLAKLRSDLDEISSMFTDARNEIKFYLGASKDEIDHYLREIDELTQSNGVR